MIFNNMTSNNIVILKINVTSQKHTSFQDDLVE